jgi:hypothetical protein
MNEMIYALLTWVLLLKRACGKSSGMPISRTEMNRKQVSFCKAWEVCDGEKVEIDSAELQLENFAHRLFILGVGITQVWVR